jgi:small subunit ribosomal protein S4
MARYIGPTCKLARREGADLGLKSSARALDSKCKLEQKPGQHGPTARKGKLSDYATQLREKQKVKRIYGLLERQFRNYYKKASTKKGNTGENLLQLLETRLDNVVYRMGFASSRSQARQQVGHGHFLVNGRRTNIPSYQVRVGDRIEVREASRKAEPFKLAKENLRNQQQPAWLTVDPDALAGTVADLPRRDQMPQELNEQLVVEYYSR